MSQRKNSAERYHASTEDGRPVNSCHELNIRLRLKN